MSGHRTLPLFFTDHALESMRKRGTDRDEVMRAIRESEWREAKYGRWEAEMEIPFDGEWNGKHYEMKKVNPVFIIEDNTIIFVTVYCFYY